jgi:hypothetical protein
MGPISGPETSVSNRPSPSNNQEDGRIRFYRGGSLRPRAVFLHSRRSLATACLPVFITVTFKYSSESSLHLVRGLPRSFLPSVVGVAMCSAFRWF